MRNINTIVFLFTWEKINNLNFNVLEFDYIKIKVGLKE